jgi:hypothetical protein
MSAKGSSPASLIGSSNPLSRRDAGDAGESELGTEEVEKMLELLLLEERKLLSGESNVHRRGVGSENNLRGEGFGKPGVLLAKEFNCQNERFLEDVGILGLPRVRCLESGGPRTIGLTSRPFPGVFVTPPRVKEASESSRAVE